MPRYKYVVCTRKNKKNNVIINDRGEVRRVKITTPGVPCASPIDFNSKAKRALINNLSVREYK